MHNNIMAAGSKDRPPMLGPGRYSQWRSRFLRYIDTKPNGEGLRKSILSGPYVPSTVLVQAVAATEGNHAIQQHTTIETVLNMTPENKEHFLSEKEAIFLLLTGIGDDIYSIVDACKIENEMWIAIKRLQQDESLNVQDVKTNLFWEFGKFTSHDGESVERIRLCNHTLLAKEPDNSLSMGDEHLDIISETESDELIKSSVENLVPIPSESEVFSDNESECDVLVGDDFTTFSNPLFDSDDDFSSSGRDVISDTRLLRFATCYVDLVFSTRINEAYFDSEEDIRLVEKLLDKNSSPRPSKELNSKISDAIIESFLPIPLRINEIFREEI
ncbi:hypothetical protein Tco_1115229 [Tanacetum coccineum]